MELEFDQREAIIAFQNLLQKRIHLLSEINEIVPRTIEFDIAGINNELSSRKKGEKTGHLELAFLEEIGGPVIYVFELIDFRQKVDVVDAFKVYRESKNARACAKLPWKSDSSNSILYVGSFENHIYRRIRQHLGLGSKSTYALQLKHWANPELKLRLHIYSHSDKATLKDLEAAFALTLNPILGKRQE